MLIIYPIPQEQVLASGRSTVVLALLQGVSAKISRDIAGAQTPMSK